MPLLGLPGGRLGATSQGNSNTNIVSGALTTTTVTAHATAHTKGSWVLLVTVPNSGGGQVCWVQLGVGTTFLAATRRDVLLDIGIGEAGSEQVLIANLSVGYRRTLPGLDMGAGFWVMLPVAVPPGTRISARMQCSTGGVTAQVSCSTWIGNPPSGWVGFNRCHTIGANTATSRGTTVTGKTFFNTPVAVAFTPTERARALVLSLGLAGATVVTAQEAVVNVLLNGTSIMQFPIFAGSDESIVGPMPNALMPVEAAFTPSATVAVQIFTASAQADFDVCAHFLS